MPKKAKAKQTEKEKAIEMLKKNLIQRGYKILTEKEVRSMMTNGKKRKTRQ
jgi:hypothetical protein